MTRIHLEVVSADDVAVTLASQSAQAIETIRYGRDGSVQARIPYAPGAAFTWMGALATDAAGNLYATGSSYTNPAASLTVKYDAQGNLLWTAQQEETIADGSADVVVDAAGNVYVAASNLLKYGPDGSLRWMAPLGREDLRVGGTALALDANGFVYAAGLRSAAFDGFYDLGPRELFVHVFDSTGALQWTYQRPRETTAGFGSPTLLPDAEGRFTLVHALGSRSDTPFEAFSALRFHVDPPGTAAEHEAGHAFSLPPLYPNPFGTEATIRYALAQPADVTLEVFDLLGRRVAVLAEGPQPAGAHRVGWRPEGLAAGVYVCRLQAGDAVAVRLVLHRPAR